MENSNDFRATKIMYDDEFDEDDDPGDLITCRECGETIYEDAVQCPHCGWFIVEDQRPWSSKPSWFRWVLVILIWLLILIMASPVLQLITRLWQSSGE